MKPHEGSSWAAGFSYAMTNMLHLGEDTPENAALIKASLIMAAIMTVKHPEWWGPTAQQLLKEQQEVGKAVAEIMPELSSVTSMEAVDRIADRIVEALPIGLWKDRDGNSIMESPYHEDPD